MMRTLFLIIIVFLFTSCASKKPDDVWRFYATSYFATFKDGKLKGEDVKAETSYNRAVTHAKSGTHFDTLKRIYLGKCALNKAMLIEDSCSEYQEISMLDKDEALESYYQFLNDKQVSDKSLLPKQYQNDFTVENYQKVEPVISRFVVASKFKDSLSKEQIDMLIDDASLFGYRALVINWLEYAYNRFHEESYKQKLHVLKK